MKSNHQALEAYYKAQSLAYWSFIGLVVPIIGIILALVSRSRLRALTGKDQDEEDRLDHAYRIAGWGLGISITLLIFYVVIGGAIGYQSAHQSQLAQQALQKARQQQQQSINRTTAIRSCMNQMYLDGGIIAGDPTTYQTALIECQQNP